ncbi:MAG: glycosyltransferase [Candidatus Omnitrophica bacterium]|nr:glycosyltransferase [Candidatus Omnitrophota bacterium]
MAVFNGGRYLKASIESVLNQTFRDFELLIIDDCSTDESLETARSFNDERIVICSNTENLGQVKSLNKGLGLARGKYVARMDADDLAFPSWLERQYEFIQQHPEYVVVSTRTAVIDSYDRVVRTLKTPLLPEDIILRCFTASPINHVGSLMQKSIILDNGGYDEHLHVPADYDLWSRLIRKGYRLTSTSDILVAIRFHDESSTIRGRGEKDISEMSEIMFENIKSLTTYPIQKESMRLYWQLNYEVGDLDRMQFQEAVDILKNIYKNLKPALGIEQRLVDAKSQKQIKTLYMKKIFASISDRDVKGVRFLSRDYLKRYGWRTIFSWVWVASFLGMIILRFFPYIYEKFLKVWTKIALRKQACPGYMH